MERGGAFAALSTHCLEECPPGTVYPSVPHSPGQEAPNKCPSRRRQAPRSKCQTPLLCLIAVLGAAVAKVQSLAPEGEGEGGGSRQPAYLSRASGIRSAHCQHTLWKNLMSGHPAKRQSSKAFCACASQTPNWLLSHLA